MKGYLAVLIAGVAIFGYLAYLNANGFDWSFHVGQGATLGHITRAYGTVKLEDQGRLETGRNILVPFHLGEQIQTGEDSAAEALFFGGGILQLQPASVARFEDAGENIAVRVVLGKAYLEFPPETMTSMRFVFRKADGKLVEMPSSRRIVVTLNSASKLEDAVEVESLDADQPFDTLADAELKYLAMGDHDVANLHPLIVRPIQEAGREPAAKTKYHYLKPNGAWPPNEANVDIEKQDKVAFSWKPSGAADSNSKAFADDPIIGYEVVVRPAFNYVTEDRARKTQVLKTRKNDTEMERIGGGGVFLWSVRAVTAGGTRGPASTPRWLEVQFPKQLAAPEFLAPKVE